MDVKPVRDQVPRGSQENGGGHPPSCQGFRYAKPGHKNGTDRNPSQSSPKDWRRARTSLYPTTRSDAPCDLNVLT